MGFGAHTSLAAAGTGRGKILLAVVVLAGIGALGWFAIPWRDFDSETFRIDDVVREEISIEGRGSDSVRSPFKGVRELVAELNNGGLRCTQAKVDSADENLTTGSCQAPGESASTHLQINIYFSVTTLEFAKEIFKERAFTYVHDDNWFVVTQLPEARQVQEILGGRLVRAKDI